jgi:hypothetical protein
MKRSFRQVAALSLVLTLGGAILGSPAFGETAWVPAVEDDIAKLKAKAESASGGKQAELYAKLAEKQAEVVSDHYEAGDLDAAQVAIDELLGYANKARDIARETRKKVKNTEIAIRKAARKLEDVSRTISIDERPVVEDAIAKLERIRRELLGVMFGLEEEKEKQRKRS